MKNLPIGYSSLVEVINNNCVYVDKTKFVKLLSNGKYYFLSRPRRFGKSLFIDTLKQAFLANKELFKDLYLEKNWDWNEIYPVIHISFGGNSAYQSQETLIAIINNILLQHAKNYDVTIDLTNYGVAFDQLIKALSDKYQKQVVILIDEYDKPILDVIHDNKQAGINREILKGLYSWIKDNDTSLKFVLLTGVSKFNKVNLFSGLNNLEDLSLDRRYADLCGYTHNELWDSFAQHLIGVNEDELQLWYNGYNFAGHDAQKVYNPFDILLFISKGKQFYPYWFETSTPTFLIRLLQSREYYLPEIENLQVGDEILGGFDVDNITIETLLFQTGYLTIKSMQPSPFDSSIIYTLGYPNFEVKKSLNSSLINYFIQDIGLVSRTKANLSQALLKNDFAQIKQVFTSFFASIPYNYYVANNIEKYEGFYATIVYAYFNAIGVTTIAEDNTNHGRIDLTLKLPQSIIIIEFKVVDKEDSKDVALAQIKSKRYFDKYISTNLPIFLVGIEFSKAKRNITKLDWEQYKV